MPPGPPGPPGQWGPPMGPMMGPGGPPMDGRSLSPVILLPFHFNAFSSSKYFTGLIGAR